MDVLFQTFVKKGNVADKVSMAMNRFDVLSSISRTERQFRIGGISGKFNLSEECPEIHMGGAMFEMFFEDVSANELGETEDLGREFFGDTVKPTVKIMIEKATEGPYLSRILDPLFVDWLGLNLGNSGLAVGNGHLNFEIIDGLRGKHSIRGKNFYSLGEKKLSEMNRESRAALKNIACLPERGMRISKKSVRRNLEKGDLGWWNVAGTKMDGITCYSEEKKVKHYIAEASAGIRTLETDFAGFFTEEFRNIMPDVSHWRLVKEKGGKSYSLALGNYNGGYDRVPVSAKVTIRKSLGSDRKCGEDVEPEVIRALNVLYGFLVKDTDIKRIFAEYIRNQTNDVCVCGEKLEDSLHKDIAQIGCFFNKKHLIHKECWKAWKKENPPKEFKWLESFCPFCRTDSSVYNIPWTGGRLVWKEIGP